MNRSKKTRTKYTEHPSSVRESSQSGTPRKLNQSRRELAAEAAKIIATEGQKNYHAAKKKAALRLGLGEHAALPGNQEIRDALHAYQNLYGGEQHSTNISRMREVAVEAMQALEAFNPRLVGAVLDGTAIESSRITMHVFSDSPDDLVIHFMDQGIAFEQEQWQIRWHDGSHRQVPVLLISLQTETIELLVFDRLQLRQSLPSPIDGKPQVRATLAQVKDLISLDQKLIRSSSREDPDTLVWGDQS